MAAKGSNDPIFDTRAYYYKKKHFPLILIKHLID